MNCGQNEPILVQILDLFPLLVIAFDHRSNVYTIPHTRVDLSFLGFHSIVVVDSNSSIDCNRTLEAVDYNIATDNDHLAHCHYFLFGDLLIQDRSLHYRILDIYNLFFLLLLLHLLPYVHLKQKLFLL